MSISRIWYNKLNSFTGQFNCNISDMTTVDTDR